MTTFCHGTYNDVKSMQPGNVGPGAVVTANDPCLSPSLKETRVYETQFEFRHFQTDPTGFNIFKLIQNNPQHSNRIQTYSNWFKKILKRIQTYSNLFKIILKRIQTYSNLFKIILKRIQTYSNWSNIILNRKAGYFATRIETDFLLLDNNFELYQSMYFKKF